MPIDTSMYSQLRPPDTINPEKLLTLAQVARQGQINDLAFQDQMATRSAFKNNLVTDQNGNTTVNRQGVLSDLMKQNPQKAMEAAQSFRQMDLARLHDQTQLANDLAAQATPDNWGQIRQQAQTLGLDNADKLPQAYDPKFVDSWKMHTQNAKDQFAQVVAQQNAQSERGKANAALAEAGAAQLPNIGSAPTGAPQKAAGSAPNGASSGASGGAVGQTADVDPSKLVGSHVPMKLQDKAYSEIKDAQNITNIAQKSLSAFDQAANEVRPMTGGTGTSLTAFVPGMESSGQKNWQGLANTTVKGVEGTARQAAFDSLKKNFMPQFGDSDATIATKRAGYIDYLKSHLSSPVNSGHGIDLTKFSSTSLPDGFGSRNTPPPPQGATKDFNGFTYKIVGDQWVKQSNKQATN